MEKTDLQRLRSKAEIYCASAEHCTSEVVSKLRTWAGEDALSSAEISQIIDHLLTNKYIDELRYATAFVNDKVRFAGWGRMKIRAGLYAKRIDESTIDQALATIDEDDYKKALDKALRQKKGATREQVARFLLSRGFEYDYFLWRLP